MFRTRPPWFAVVCIGIWLLQLVLIAFTFHWIGSVESSMQRWWELAAAGATMGLGAMLLVQLPRAMQWRPRLNPRPSAEVIAERRRIARDLHDNLGSQLVCALASLDPSKPREREIHSVLEKCLLDLRWIVDSMDSADAPFADRLAQLRYRIDPVLERNGIRMVWEVETPQCASFPHPDSATHLVAIVQEALSNALQHARATEIEVSARNLPDTDAWCVEIRDNGQGMERLPGPQNTVATGKGMASMARRAINAGGELQVLHRENGGTCIRVVVPCAFAP
ncbi:MAG: sensor histidine kinase [Acidovorax sp.]|uniref:sensor histidine kinase n=1 Tax=Acidovorax sp. TaxID=1872122 RepID=UPI00391B08C6